MKTSEALLGALKTEYLWILIVILGYVALVLLISLVIILTDKKDKMNDMPLIAYIAFAYGRVGLAVIAFFLTCVVNPVRILIRYWVDLTEVVPVLYRIFIYAAVFIPLPVAVCVFLFGVLKISINRKKDEH